MASGRFRIIAVVACVVAACWCAGALWRFAARSGVSPGGPAPSSAAAPSGHLLAAAQPAGTLTRERPPAPSPAGALIADRERPAAARVAALAGLSEAVAADRAVALAVLADARDQDVVRNEAATTLARLGDPGLVEALVAVLRNAENGERFRGYAVQHLGEAWQRERAARGDQAGEIRDALAALVGDRHSDVRREALLALARGGDPLAGEIADRWLSDPAATGERDAAIRVVGDLDRRLHLPLLRTLSGDADDIVRVAALAVLATWRDADSRERFATAARSPTARVREAGERGLAELARAGGQP